MITQNTALFTIFGATGDLAHRKLYPSLFRLYKKDSSKIILPLSEQPDETGPMNISVKWSWIPSKI